jgi:hypothetical protein
LFRYCKRVINLDAEISNRTLDLGVTEQEPTHAVFSARSPLPIAVSRHRLPAMLSFSAYTRAGGLMSYGIDPVPPWRRAASYVVKILRESKA